MTKEHKMTKIKIKTENKKVKAINKKTLNKYYNSVLCLLQVDQGLETGLTPGMKLEVCVRTESETAYWVATIITTCGQLLLLRYEGYQDDRRADFWCDIMTADLHPIGWSKQQGRPMKPPEGENGD